MTTRTLALATAVLAGVAVAGCATVISGTTQMMTISSNVDGAEIFLDGEKIGTTPFTAAVPKNKSAVRVEAEGYQGENLSLSKSIDPMFFGNIIIGGTLGSITDFATGAAFQYAPSTYQVELRARGQSEQAYRGQLATRKFAMVYATEISQDIAAGGGEYLDALMKIMTEYAGAAATESDVRNAMAASRGNVVRFGQEVVELL